MAPSTAISLLGLATAAWLRQSRPASVAAIRFGKAVALVVLTYSVLIWAEFLFGIELSLVSPVAGTTETIGQIPVGKMSPLTALACLLASVGLMTQVAGAKRKALRQTGAILAVLLLVLASGVTLSYILRVPLFYSGTVIPMAALTAIGFTLLAAGLLMRTGADTWPMGLFVPHAPGAPQSRRPTWGFLVMAVLLMAGIGAAGFAYLRHEQRDASRVAAENLSAIGNLKVDQIAGWYRERLADANTVLNTPLRVELNRFLEDPSDEESRERLLAWMRALQREDDYLLVALLDGRGLAHLSVPSSIAGSDPRLLEECRRALRQRTVVIHGLHRHESDPLVHLSIIIPLANDRADALLLLEVDAAQSLFPLVQSWPTPTRSGEMLLVKREGDEVVYLNELRHRKGAALNLRMRIDEMPRLPAARAVSGHEGVFEGEDYRQVSVLAVSRAIPGTPWFLVAKIDRAEIYAAFRRDVATTALLVGVLLLAVVSGVGVLWHRRGLAWAERELVLQQVNLERERSFRAEADRAAEAVRIAHQRLRRFIDSNIVGIVIARPDGAILEANDYYLRLIGATREEFEQGKVDWRAITPPEWIPADELAIRELLERGTCTPYEKEYIRPDGTRVPVFLIDAMLEGPDPQIAAFALDLTERKRAEEVLRSREELLNNVGRIAKIGGWEFDPLTGKGSWTAEVARIHGLDPTELTSVELGLSFYRDESRAAIEQALKDTVELKLDYDLELELITPGGEHKWVNTRGHPTLEGGRVVRVSGSFQDITERKLAEQHLLRLTEILNASQTAARVGGWEVDLVDDSLFWTDETHRIHDTSPSEYTPTLATAMEFFTPESIPILREVLQTPAAGLDARCDADLELITRTGRHKWVHFTPSLTVERGRPVRLTCAIQDVTVRKLAESERLELTSRLHQSQKLESLGSLAGGVAHDINNVLAAILSTASAHRRQLKDADALAHSLDTITNACLRGRSVVRSLLYFARHDVVTRGPVDLNAIAREIVHLLDKTTLKRVQFAIDVEEPLASVDGDAGAISHAIMNLCVNSLDAIPDGGGVTIRTSRRSEGFVEIRVSDSGVGMTPEVRDKAIEPFFTTKPQGEGTGLGLAMVYGTVKAHEGTFEIVSETGKGTEIILGFPVSPVRETKSVSPAATVAGPEPVSTAPLRILLVDDDDLVRAGLGTLLELEGHEVHLAEGGSEALAHFRADVEVDLVMLDMHMPGMNGAETLERLLAIRPQQVVLLSSGHRDDEMARLMTGRPNVTAIQKPFTLDELQERLAALGLRS